MEDVEFGEVSDGSFTIEAQKDPTPVTEPTVILNRTATVLFDASWKKDEAKPKKRLERQMSRPDHRVTLSWSDLKVVAPGQGPSLVQRARGISTTNPDKVILKNVSGIAKPGQLIAIMGASGAGKSTLLNVLASQNTSRLKVNGIVRLNGIEASASDISHVSAYVQQEDIFFGTLTVIEHLTFQAITRMERWIPIKQKLERVEQVLHEMGLKKCEGTVIGIPGKIKGISGGEKKRLSFASEILTNPALLFLDEPTSGLDSFMAEAVVKLLFKVAATGRTILCTIHQPSSEIYALFDHVLLLAEGRIAFVGPSVRTSQFLAENGHICPENFNPADFYIHTLAIVPGSEQECKEKVTAICDAFEASELGDAVKAEIKQLESRESSRQLDERGHQMLRAGHEGRSYNASFFTQLRYVLWRSWLSNIRDPTATKVKFSQSIVLAILLGLMYLQVDLDNTAVQNISGALTFTLIQLSIGNIMPVLQVIPMEMPVFLREHRTRLYRTSIYFIAKGLADIPFIIVLSFIFSAIAYFMIGLRSGAEHFFAFYGVVLTVALIAVSVGYCASAAAPSVAVALAVGPMTFVPFLLFGGFFQRTDTVKDYLVWIKFLSWFYYGFELLMVNQWDGLTLDNFNATSNNCTTQGTVSFCKGEEVLDFFGLDPDNVERDIGLLFVLLFAARALSLIILLVRVRRSES